MLMGHDKRRLVVRCTEVLVGGRLSHDLTTVFLPET